MKQFDEAPLTIGDILRHKALEKASQEVRKAKNEDDRKEAEKVRAVARKAFEDKLRERKEKIKKESIFDRNARGDSAEVASDYALLKNGAYEAHLEKYAGTGKEVGKRDFNVAPHELDKFARLLKNLQDMYYGSPRMMNTGTRMLAIDILTSKKPRAASMLSKQFAKNFLEWGFPRKKKQNKK